jgi:hypothetical protein
MLLIPQLSMSPEYSWAIPEIASRAESLKKELEGIDLDRDALIELASAHKAYGEWLERLLKSRNFDARLRALAFPACCTFPLGFTSDTKVVGGETRRVTSRTQVPFQGCRLAVDPECAPYFTILNLRVGDFSQFVNAEPIAATTFPPLVADWDSEDQEKAHKELRLGLRLALPGVDVSLLVQNVDRDAPHIFRAALWGHTHETC